MLLVRIELHSFSSLFWACATASAICLALGDYHGSIQVTAAIIKERLLC